MRKKAHRKQGLLVLWFVLLGLFVSGCATVPPQPITGAAPTQTATDAPIDEATQAPDGTQEATPDAADASAVPMQATLPVSSGIAPTAVEIFYSGTPSMMGFADASQATIYENTMDALPACVSLCWPGANVSYYRYSGDFAKDDMRMAKDQLLSAIGNPSFYLDTPMLTQPARLKREGQPLITEAINMNEPIRSLWETLGRDMPAIRSQASGTPVAVSQSDPSPSSLTVIVTDLHELRMDDGALLSALNESSLQAGRSIGIAAITSEFAGFIPDIGANNTTYVWGAPPTGTLDYTLDYTDYKMGISIDPEQRKMASRPFYVLCIGDQAAVNTYLETLSQRLTSEFTGNSTFKMDTAVFGSAYVREDYNIAGNMRYIAGQGVTAIPENTAPAGINLIELKASQQARYVEWQVDYKVHPADPRGTSLKAEDFTFTATAVSGENRTALPDLTYSILSTTGDTVTLSLRLDLPQGIIPQGNYTLEISGSLSAPTTLPGSEWMATYGYDADGAQLFDMEQNTAAFDGGRTLFLSRLIDTLGKANIGRLGVASLGIVTITFTVYA